jgi:hypothetical protein
MLHRNSKRHKFQSTVHLARYTCLWDLLCDPAVAAIFSLFEQARRESREALVETELENLRHGDNHFR